jgi:hypothetical protein
MNAEAERLFVSQLWRCENGGRKEASAGSARMSSGSRGHRAMQPPGAGVRVRLPSILINSEKFVK